MRYFAHLRKDYTDFQFRFKTIVNLLRSTIYVCTEEATSHTSGLYRGLNWGYCANQGNWNYLEPKSYKIKYSPQVCKVSQCPYVVFCTIPILCMHKNLFIFCVTFYTIYTLDEWMKVKVEKGSSLIQGLELLQVNIVNGI